VESSRNEIWFHSKDPETSWLSNFSPNGFELSATRWPSVEHYYQAQKYPNDPVFARIRAAEKAAIARKIGQDRSLSPRTDWNEIKIEVMATAIRAKFTQNRALRAKLLATDAAELIHFSKSDKFWGRERDGAGQNRLGELFMALREDLRTQA